VSSVDGSGSRRRSALVTGAAGFIGSHLVDHLLALGWRIRGLDDLSTGRHTNLRAAQSSPHFELVEGSVLDDRLVHRLASDATRIFHLAGRVGPTHVEQYPEETVLETIRATCNLLDAVRGRSVPVFVASSSEIYGDSAVQPLREDADLHVAPPSHPRSSYALGRGVSELLVNTHVRNGHGPAVVGRMFNTIGLRQSPDYGYVVPRFLRWARTDQPIAVHGTGEQTRSFTAVADVVRAVVELVDRPAAYGRTVNIGSRDEVTINHLARLVIELTGSASTIRHVPYEEEHGAGARDIRRRLPDTGTLRALLSRELSTPLEVMIRGMLTDAVPALPRGAALMAAASDD
jgi:UDP-glucose 4-epimerase